MDNLSTNHHQLGFIGLAAGILVASVLLVTGGYFGLQKYIDVYGSDFGDAPDGTTAYQNGEIEIAGKFPSQKASNGLRAKDNSQVWLGKKVDKELESKQVNSDKFDDGLAVKQQENGLTQTAYFAVNIAKPGKLTGKAYLNFWIDLNSDGAWSADEWVVKNQTVDLSSQKESFDSYSAEFVSANQVSNLWRRASVSYEQQLSSPTGEIKIGEVEDFGPPIFGKEKNYFAKCDPEPLMLNHGQGGYIEMVTQKDSEPIASYWVKKGSSLKDKAKEIKDSGNKSLYYKSTQVDGPKRLVIDEVKIQYRFIGWSKKFTNTCDVWIQHDEKGSGPPPGGDDDGDGEGDKDKDKDKDKEKEKTVETKDTTAIRSIRPEIVIGMTGEYTITNTNNQSSLNIKFKPSNQKNLDLGINGLELPLTNQDPKLPANPSQISLNLNNNNAGNWQCQTGSDSVKCQGTTPLQLNQETQLNIIFAENIEQMNPMYLYFLKDANVIGAMNPIAK